jgi:hypothetical protein
MQGKYKNSSAIYSFIEMTLYPVKLSLAYSGPRRLLPNPKNICGKPFGNSSLYWVLKPDLSVIISSGSNLSGYS